jgi:hypothetical protein
MTMGNMKVNEDGDIIVTGDWNPRPDIPAAILTFEDPISVAKALLTANGYVMHRAKSWRQLIERVRVAECYRDSEIRATESTRGWARDCLAEERRLRDRCTFLYGMACAKGATVEELRGGIS